jgi:cytochrome c-type biogenesis protein CcmH/NrfF
VAVAEMMMVVAGSLAAAAAAAAVHQTQTLRRLAESLNCQCCQVYYLVQFQKQQLEYSNTQHMK